MKKYKKSSKRWFVLIKNFFNLVDAEKIVKYANELESLERTSLCG